MNSGFWLQAQLSKGDSAAKAVAVASLSQPGWAFYKLEQEAGLPPHPLAAHSAVLPRATHEGGGGDPVMLIQPYNTCIKSRLLFLPGTVDHITELQRHPCRAYLVPVEDKEGLAASFTNSTVDRVGCMGGLSSAKRVVGADGNVGVGAGTVRGSSFVQVSGHTQRPAREETACWEAMLAVAAANPQVPFPLQHKAEYSDALDISRNGAITRHGSNGGNGGFPAYA